MALAECQKMVDATGDNGTMTAEGQSLSGTSHLTNAFSLNTSRLTFGGDRTRIGTLEWAQRVTVDGRTENATSQVTALMPFNVHFGANEFYGFIASVGISYPGGQSIIQDPAISSQAVTDVVMSTSGSGNGGGSTGNLLSSFPIGMVLIAVVAAIVVASMVLIRRRGGGKGPVDYEKPNDAQQDDWSKYYEKK